MNWYDDEVRMLEVERDRDPEAVGSIVFYGSSSIRLWDTLTADLGRPGIRIRNLGFGGSTLEECALLFRRLVVPCRPRALVLYVGDNDLGHGRPPEAIAASFDDLIDQVDADLGSIRVAYLSIKPSPALWTIHDQVVDANKRIEGRLSRRPNSDYIDVHAKMLGPDGRPRRELFADDGLHLTPAGYRVWAETILTEYPDVLS